eukprot:1427851-Amphidinium_carterae.1
MPSRRISCRALTAVSPRRQPVSTYALACRLSERRARRLAAQDRLQAKREPWRGFSSTSSTEERAPRQAHRKDGAQASPSGLSLTGANKIAEQ